MQGGRQTQSKSLPTEQNASCKASFQNKKIERLSWTGECVNGLTEGNGELRAITNGSVWTYNGQMKNGRPDGYGKYIDEVGGYYEGNFKNGEYYGKGKYVLYNGDTYTGEFFNGKRHGEGVFLAGGAKKEAQSGRWENDSFLGVYIKDEKSNCSVINPNPKPNETITYSGGCKDGLAEGMGKLAWYLDGKLNGRDEGKFIKGQLTQGKIWWENGDYYEGTLTNWKIDGLTKYQKQQQERRSQNIAKACDEYYPGKTGTMQNNYWLATDDDFVVRYVNKERKSVTIEGTTRSGGNSLARGAIEEMSCAQLRSFETVPSGFVGSRPKYQD